MSARPRNASSPEASVTRLREIGAWMKVNGAAIYGTTASPFAKLPWGRCTQKTQDGVTTLYLHVFDWPADGRLSIAGLKNPVAQATLLASGERLEVSRDGAYPVLAVSQRAPDASEVRIPVRAQDEPNPSRSRGGPLRPGSPPRERSDAQNRLSLSAHRNKAPPDRPATSAAPGRPLDFSH